MLDQPIRMGSVQANHVSVISVTAKQEDEVIQKLFAAAIAMASCKAFPGGIRNEDRGLSRGLSMRRFPVRCMCMA